MKHLLIIPLLLFSFCSIGQTAGELRFGSTKIFVRGPVIEFMRVDTVQRVWATALGKDSIPRDSLCLEKWRKFIEYYLPEEKDKIFRYCKKQRKLWKKNRK